ncbi:hypothetical protein QQS21_006062 [Conoideocrella luteorostrata]|uniref:Xylanolytic transcriptional activator regulatory domain-containing protein n=1 Tax=Conoideocrella luteorostrata TaxID=1105319 RepID=A0AAJ0CQS3_9HYPO|nr:hypothetical protein QQS21_006062 [Conoideocrella luteorostrata]
MHKSASTSGTARRYCEKCFDLLPSVVVDSPPPTSAATEHSMVGRLEFDDCKTTYISNTHWKAVLEDITELKSLCQDDALENTAPPAHQAQYVLEGSILAPGSTRERPRLLSGWHKPVSIEEILGAMPERAVVDRLVLGYFKNPPLPHAILHASSFLRQYEKFWSNPYNTPLMWIALLYGIICLTTQANDIQNVEAGNLVDLSSTGEDCPFSRPRFLDQMEQALIAGNYSNGGPFALEALLHYHIIEHTKHPDADVGTWLLTGMIVRLGFRMGYHRDPSHFQDVTPFQGEMRRRVWIFLHALDVMMSLQLGLPRVIKDSQWDTKPPRNLADSEFDEDSSELPSRPESHITPMLHQLAKHKMLLVVGAIADTSMSVTADVHDASALATEKRLTEQLRAAYGSIPGNLKFETPKKCLSDEPYDNMNRMTINMLLHKGLIVLNWRRVMPGGSVISPQDHATHDKYGTSQTDTSTDSYQTCINAALKILEFQHIIDSGALGSRQLLILSVVKHEFLMATTVLITHMYRVGINWLSCRPETQVIEATLRRSHEIWIRQGIRSKEAMRVAHMLDMLFAKLKDVRTPPILGDTELADQADNLLLQPGDPGLALFGEFGLLQHLEDLGNLFSVYSGKAT